MNRVRTNTHTKKKKKSNPKTEGGGQFMLSALPCLRGCTLAKSAKNLQKSSKFHRIFAARCIQILSKKKIIYKIHQNTSKIFKIPQKWEERGSTRTAYLSTVDKKHREQTSESRPEGSDYGLNVSGGRVTLYRACSAIRNRGSSATGLAVVSSNALGSKASRSCTSLSTVVLC